MRFRKSGGRALSYAVLALAFIFLSTGTLLAGSSHSPSLPVPDDERQGLPTIHEAVLLNADLGNFSTLAKLLKDAFGTETLNDFFDGNPHVTVFAPTNDAFDALFDRLTEDQKNTLLDVNNGLLANILLYHMAPGDWYWPGPIGALKMADDNLANVYREGKTLKIEGAAITDQKVFKNGVVLSIDTVLNPPDTPEYLGCSPFVSEHDNYLYFSSFTNLQVDWTGHSVTSCQPWGGVSVSGSSSILVKAGRHDSSGPANFFTSDLDSDNMLTTADLGDSEPYDLNFAVVGNMTATVVKGVSGSETFTCPNIRFGQGSSDATNNWWVGQPGAYPCSSNPDNGQPGLGLKCTSDQKPGETLMFFQIIGIPGYEYTFGVINVTAGGCS
jgi:uncharacterized surface protein with fasciclin (FAS1) repeats